MQAQAQISKVEAKGELLLEIHGKMVSMTIKELSPLGVKLEINDEGKVEGRYNASRNATVSIFQKLDGTFEWESKEIHSTAEGDFVLAAGRGTGRFTGPGKGEGEGELSFMTTSPKLSWINNTKAWLEASVGSTTGATNLRVYAKK